MFDFDLRVKDQSELAANEMRYHRILRGSDGHEEEG